MQTFLPYADFEQSAKSLDDSRLYKQCLEGFQIANILVRKRGWEETPLNEAGKPMKGYWNHPAVLMWEGYEPQFVAYIMVCCGVWAGDRFGKETFSGRIATMYRRSIFPNFDTNTIGQTPPWLGKHEFHLAHQSNLVRKNMAHYGPQFPDVPPTLSYIWPVQMVKGVRRELYRREEGI